MVDEEKMAQEEKIAKKEKMTEKKTKIWIDCDPGIDDAIALAAAAASQDTLQICGISTVAGNQTSDRVTENARKLAAFYGMEEVPVVRGARKPLLRKMEDAGEIHGETGVGSVRLPETKKKLASESGIFYMYTQIMHLQEKETITLVPTGPLTNIALLLCTFPEVKERISRIVLMGGSSIGGNVTPEAEFNIWADPEAAQIVFSSGLPIVMCGLDVTARSGLSKKQVEELCTSSQIVEKTCGEMLRFYLETAAEEKMDVVGIHDAVTILYITNPELFQGKKVSVTVDCSEGKRRGATICTDASREETKASVYMLNQVNLPAFQKIVLSKLNRL